MIALIAILVCDQAYPIWPYDSNYYNSINSVQQPNYAYSSNGFDPSGGSWNSAIVSHVLF